MTVCETIWDAVPDPCVGWFSDGYAWHACHLDPGHVGLCACPCGATRRAQRRATDTTASLDNARAEA